MPGLAVRPDGLPATRVPRNNLPPLRFQPAAPLAPHCLLSLWFRKTTRLTTTTRRLFAGRVGKYQAWVSIYGHVSSFAYVSNKPPIRNTGYPQLDLWTKLFVGINRKGKVVAIPN